MVSTALYKGDCIEIMSKIPDKSVDMVLCDLPYGTTQLPWDTIIPFDKLWEAYHRIVKENGAFVLFGSEPFSSRLRLSNFNEFKYDWVWVKSMVSGFLDVKIKPLKCYELISVFYKKQPTYNPQFSYSDKIRPTVVRNTNHCKQYGATKDYLAIDDGKRYPKNILYFQNKNNESFHPTQKPTDLLQYLIETYTNRGETVLDNTMGSGSTGVACVNIKRNFIGIELNDEYFKIAQERIDKALQENNMLLKTKEKENIPKKFKFGMSLE